MKGISRRMYKFYSYCPECNQVMLFKKRGTVWEDKAGHEYDWHRDIISEMKGKRRENKRRKKKWLKSR